MPTLQHVSRINDVLHYVHQDISRELPAKELAQIAAYTEQHFHRVFKQVVGESVHQYIRRCRMEYAANQLMFDTASTIIDVANKVGFNSVSSFTKAFKATFSVSPGEWRRGEEDGKEKPYLADLEIAAAYHRLSSRSVVTPKIKEVEERRVAYIRHSGYSRAIKNSWLLLQAWAMSEQRDFSQQFGLHHSNPAWVKLDKCRYVACVGIDKSLTYRSMINQMVIPGGLYAIFSLSGVYGELLPQISHILERWLPTSGFKMASTPSYVHYKKNHFLADDEYFELDFHLPISFY